LKEGGDCLPCIFKKGEKALVRRAFSFFPLSIPSPHHHLTSTERARVLFYLSPFWHDHAKDVTRLARSSRFKVYGKSMEFAAQAHCV